MILIILIKRWYWKFIKWEILSNEGKLEIHDFNVKKENDNNKELEKINDNKKRTIIKRKILKSKRIKRLMIISLFFKFYIKLVFNSYLQLVYKIWYIINIQ